MPEGALCEPSGCPTLTACCLTDGTCTLLYRLQCAERDGTYLGEGIECTPTTCAPASMPEPGIREETWGQVKSRFE